MKLLAKAIDGTMYVAWSILGIVLACGIMFVIWVSKKVGE